MSGFEYGKSADGEAGKTLDDHVILHGVSVKRVFQTKDPQYKVVSLQYDKSDNKFGNIVIRADKVKQNEKGSYDVDLGEKGRWCEIGYRKGNEYLSERLDATVVKEMFDASEKAFAAAQRRYAIAHRNDVNTAKPAAEKPAAVSETNSQVFDSASAEVSVKSSEQQAAQPEKASVAESKPEAKPMKQSDSKLIYLNGLSAKLIHSGVKPDTFRVSIPLFEPEMGARFGNIYVNSNQIIPVRDKNTSVPVTNRRNIRLGEESASYTMTVVKDSKPVQMNVTAGQIIDMYQKASMESLKAYRQKQNEAQVQQSLGMKVETPAPTVAEKPKAQPDFADSFEGKAAAAVNQSVEQKTGALDGAIDKVAAAEAMCERVVSEAVTVQEYVNEHPDEVDAEMPF